MAFINEEKWRKYLEQSPHRHRIYIHVQTHTQTCNIYIYVIHICYKLIIRYLMILVMRWASLRCLHFSFNEEAVSKKWVSYEELHCCTLIEIFLFSSYTHFLINWYTKKWLFASWDIYDFKIRGTRSRKCPMGLVWCRLSSLITHGGKCVIWNYINPSSFLREIFLLVTITAMFNS